MSDLKSVVTESFIRYAGNVILDRAICDVRDMLKPSARMLMYSQLHITKNTPSNAFVKSARVVGDCLGHYYVHGDSSCYSTYMRMAKPFAMRYPLEDCQGNSGTITQTGDEAAPRYTELRLSKLGAGLFDSIEKDSISDWYDNFDETEKYPKVLPSKGFYNIVNGSTGIGVSLSASIPQFNIVDINNALINLINNKNFEVDILPDFATGGILVNPTEVKESLKYGTGAACKLRSVIEYDVNNHYLIVKEIPYGVYTNTISEEISKLVESDPACGIDHINDGSGITPDYIIYLSKGANPDRVIKLLYKETSLQSFYSINMNVLVDNGRTPKTLGLKEMLLSHIEHEKEIYRRGFNYDLRKINSRIHIIEGLLICMASIDEVVHTIKSSSSTSEANIALQRKFLLDADQARAVLDMKLSRLAHLEVQKLENEKKELEKKKADIEAILNDEVKFNNELIKGWQDTAKKFGDERRTRIAEIVDDENPELQDIVAENCIVVLTEGNTLKRIPTKNFTPQRRNGKGIKNQEDITSMIIRTNTLDNLMIFTNKGNMYRLLVDEIPEGTNQSKGYPIDALVSMAADEQAQVIYSIYRDTNAQYVMFVTKQGMIKKTSLEEYLKTKKKNGLMAINLKENDSLASVFLIKDEPIIILTKHGYGIKIKSTEISTSGRVTMGVKGITLNDKDEVVTSLPIRDINDSLAVFAENGTAKKFLIKDIPLQNRGGKGLIYSKELAAAAALISDKDMILVVGNKNSICVKAEDIPIGNRTMIGNQIIKGNKIIGVSKV